MMDSTTPMAYGGVDYMWNPTVDLLFGSAQGSGFLPDCYKALQRRAKVHLSRLHRRDRLRYTTWPREPILTRVIS